MTSAGLAELVDLDRYPIDRPGSAEFDDLCTRCRRELDEHGVSILDRFVTDTALHRLVAESARHATLGHASDVVGTPYLEAPADTWPDGHPRLARGHTRLTAVAYDLFEPDAVLRRLYESDVVLDIKPMPRSSGFKFEDKITGGVVPRNYIPSVEEGALNALKHGPLGFPVVDVLVSLVDGSHLHDVRCGGGDDLASALDLWDRERRMTGFRGPTLREQP